MALEKLKQVQKDPVLDKAPKAEHGLATYAHLNVLVEYINKLEERIAALEQAG